MENYYEACAIPKPSGVKKKKKYNGYKDKPSRLCYYCGTLYAERHEVYGGPNRQTSIDNGFQVDLCPDCHRSWHQQAEQLWIKRKKEWQQHYQIAYESKLIAAGISSGQARNMWMGMIGKNYIDEIK